MTGTSSRQFGLVIAYVLPGFVALAGIAPLFPAVARWLRPVGQGDLGLGPPLYAVLAATAIGLGLSCFRWISLDHVHHWTGVRRPAWDDSQLDRVLGGFDYLVQSHFRYYEFCGNTLLATLWSYGLNRLLGTFPFLGAGTDFGVAVILFVLFLAREMRLRTTTTERAGSSVARRLWSHTMYNGNDHGASGAPSQPKPKPQDEPRTEPAKPQPKPDKPKQH
jgi:hypothetical protein